MKRVIIESPYAGDIERNTEYARRCLKDSLGRGEAPLASHLLYPQVLDENDPEQRKQGVDAGLAWMGVRGWGPEDPLGEVQQVIALYVDYGMSRGMINALDRANRCGGVSIDVRTIGKNPGDADG